MEPAQKWDRDWIDPSGDHGLSVARKIEGVLVSPGARRGWLNIMANKPIRILTVDDHPVLREGIAAVLSAEPDMVLIGEANNGREALEQFRIHRPDITLMDLQMPVMGGSDAIAAIRKEFPDARIIVLTTYSGDAQAGRAFKAGAYGYLLKSMLRKELVETIRIVHGGRKKMPPEIAVELVEHHAEDALSGREIEVLRQLGTGNSNKMIADNLNLSEETVKAHMRNILSKLGANDRTHALAIALKRGIIEI
jgi:DNA-binding NarL/FixJ family response regulator